MRRPDPARAARALSWPAAAAAGTVAATWLDGDLWRLLAALAALAVLVAPRLPRVPAAALPAARTRLLLLLAVAATAQATAPDLRRFTTSPWVRVWNVYHYFLGSKYFPELGYHDLYVATLTADQEDRDYWASVRWVRDLSTYEVLPRRQALAGYDPREHFTDARWHDFRRDVRALQEQREPRRWRGIFRDRGYNPTPLWTAVGRLLTPLPADRLWILKILCALDLVLLAATFRLVDRTFGRRALACSLLLFSLSPVNEGRLVGGFLQYDWFCALAAGFCLLRRGRAWPAGALLAYAAGTRIFPALLLVSAAVPRVVDWVRSAFLARRDRRAAVALAVCGAAALAAGGLAAGRGAWPAFAANVLQHSEAHTYGQRRIGLAHAFTRDVASLDFHEPDRERRRELLARQRKALWACGAALLVPWLAAVARRSPPDALLLGMVPFFVLTVSSRYYWACLALLPLLARPGPSGRRRVRRLTAAQAAVLAVLGVAGLRGFGAFAYYSVFDLALGGLLTVLLLAFLVHDARVRRRYRRRLQVSPRRRL